MTNKLISIIVPAYNEELYLEQTIKAISNWPVNKEIIVVDDGSIDDTKKILEMSQEIYGVKAIFLYPNQGKGQALMEGIKNINGSIVVFLDADLGQSAENAISLLDPILDNSADLTVAILPKGKNKGGFGLVVNLAQRGIYQLTGFRTTAPLSGQRALKREVLDGIKLVKDFGIEVGLTIDAIRKGYRVIEVEVPLYHRETGRDFHGFIHRGKEFIAVSKALFIKWRKKAL